MDRKKPFKLFIRHKQQAFIDSYCSCSFIPVSDALCTLCPDWPLYSVLLSDRWCLWRISLLRFSFPATVSSRFKLDLKERATTNKIKCEPVQMAAVKLLPNKTHATANVSLLACSQKLPTATLNLGMVSSMTLKILWHRKRILKTFCPH